MSNWSTESRDTSTASVQKGPKEELVIASPRLGSPNSKVELSPVGVSSFGSKPTNISKLPTSRTSMLPIPEITTSRLTLSPTFTFCFEEIKLKTTGPAHSGLAMSSSASIRRQLRIGISLSGYPEFASRALSNGSTDRWSGPGAIRRRPWRSKSVVSFITSLRHAAFRDHRNGFDLRTRDRFLDLNGNNRLANRKEAVH